MCYSRATSAGSASLDADLGFGSALNNLLCFALKEHAVPSVSGAVQAKPSLLQSISDLSCMEWMQAGRWGMEASTEARQISRKGPEPTLALFSLSPSSLLAKGGEDAHAKIPME